MPKRSSERNEGPASNTRSCANRTGDLTKCDLSVVGRSTEGRYGSASRLVRADGRSRLKEAR